MKVDADIVALQIARQIDAIPPAWPAPRRTAHAQVLIRDALQKQAEDYEAVLSALRDALNED